MREISILQKISSMYFFSVKQIPFDPFLALSSFFQLYFPVDIVLSLFLSL